MNIADSKLKIPNYTPHLTRHRLVAELDHPHPSSLILVTGDTGYGKTICVSNYIMEKNIPCVWYSLSNTDCYAHVFLSYLKKGILQLKDKHAPNEIIEPQYVETELNTLISLMADLSQPVWIVLDDYQWIDKSPEIQSIMNRLLDECSSAVRFIIISQVRPHLPLSKLKIKHKYKELTTFDLAFTVEETRDFFNSMHELELEDHEIKLIQRRTEGWVASYQLLLGLISNLNREERARFWTSFPHVQDIYDYLSTEVFEAQNEEIQSFLCKTSLLSELDPTVMNRFLHIDHSEKILKHLLTRHLFIYQDDQGVIRYHRLFRRFLYEKYKEQVGNEEIRSTHLALAHIYEEQYKFVFSFVHLIIGKDYSKAAKIMGMIGDRYNPIESMTFLNGWLEEISFEESIANNTLFLIRCIPLSVLKELTVHLEENIMLLKKEKNELWLCNLQHRLATICLMRGELMKAKHLFLESLKGSEKFRDYPMTALNLNLLAEIYRYLEDYSEAMTAIRRALYISDQYGNKHTQLHALDTIATIYLDEGKINEATPYIQQAIDIAQNDDHSSLVFVYTTRGRMSRLQGNIYEAIEWGKKAVEIADMYNTNFDKGWANQELGNSYLENQQWTEAEGCFSEAYQSFSLFTHYQCVVLMSQRTMYEKRGDSKKEKEKTNELLQLCREHDYHWLVKEIKPVNQVMIKEKEAPSLEIYTLGHFKIYYRGKPITIKRKSSLQLLQFLITNRNKKIEKDILMEALFPEGLLDSVQNQFHVSLSVLRKTIEPDLEAGNQSSYILRSKSHYLFDTRHVHLDVERFKELTAIDNEQNVQNMLMAVELYKGDYFEEYPYASFLEAERDSLRLQYFNICRSLAHYYSRQGDDSKSFELFENILKKDPYQEQAYFEYIQLLLNKNFSAQAKGIAERMTQYVEEEMGIEVQGRLTELFETFQTPIK
ncbi:hypothetical protein AC623_18095 [Bacillus sp. FJAT-27231]|uniref:tetratricopeptide repeat protein n=1 Tax=Bacillus sp. FJAT-27231 TaxID=1679168 RepID=UPI0006707700|nr:tetratricopeptide repeat protein [Bacillus sp. FJAT-27231]KMY55606.1 hypothetical protein AC623_18095 [Bacillus sp. FJAT-27231]